MGNSGVIWKQVTFGKLSPGMSEDSVAFWGGALGEAGTWDQGRGQGAGPESDTALFLALALPWPQP